jgi:hypothetical protein
MEWAQQDKTSRPAEWAKRLSFVRGFARHWSAHDSQTEVPPSGLLSHRPGRAHPYLYSNEEEYPPSAAPGELQESIFMEASLPRSPEHRS